MSELLKLDLKARLRNKSFWVYMTSAVALLAQQLGFKFIPANYSDIVNSILFILTIVGIIVDNSTPGISDSIIPSVASEASTNVSNMSRQVNTLNDSNVVSEASNALNTTSEDKIKDEVNS